MKLFAPKKQQNSLIWMGVAICAGFCLMLLLSLFAYKMESRYVRALESKSVSQQGRIDELEKLVNSKDKK